MGRFSAKSPSLSPAGRAVQHVVCASESFSEETNLPTQSNLLAEDARGRLYVATEEGHIIRTDGRRTTSGA
eukprot:69520-Pyramimonas_sp.AAC.4